MHALKKALSLCLSFSLLSGCSQSIDDVSTSIPSPSDTMVATTPENQQPYSNSPNASFDAFLEASFKDALTVANRKHDMVAIQVYDQRETELPSVGLMKIKDDETGKEQWIDTSSSRVRQAYKEWWEKRQEAMDATFKKCRVDSVSIRTEDDYVKSLMALFEKRN